MTTALARLLRNGSAHNKIATGPVPSGSVVVTAEGNIAIFQGLKAAVLNDTISLDNQEVYLIDNVNAVAWTEGQTVYWDNVNLCLQPTGLIRVGRVAGTVASTSATVPVRLLKDAREAHQAAVAAGAALTNSTVATIMGSVTIPANYLQAGDRLRIRGQVVAPATNLADTLQLNLLLTPGTSGAAVTLAATAAVDVANNDNGYFDVEVVIRTVGANGTMVAAGVQALGTPGTVTAKPTALGSSTVDTTQPQVIGVQGTWSAANAGDSARLDMLNVDLIRA